MRKWAEVFVLNTFHYKLKTNGPILVLVGEMEDQE